MQTLLDRVSENNWPSDCYKPYLVSVVLLLWTQYTFYICTCIRYVCTHARTHTHARTRTRTHTHTRAHTCTYAHTQTKLTFALAYPSLIVMFLSNSFLNLIV